MKCETLAMKTEKTWNELLDEAVQTKALTDEDCLLLLELAIKSGEMYKPQKSPGLVMNEAVFQGLLNEVLKKRKEEK